MFPARFPTGVRKTTIPNPATVAKIRKELLQLTPELDVTNYVNWLA